MPNFGGTRAHSRFEAELAELTKVLRSFGVLTHDNLRELSGARHWCGPRFETVLQEAVCDGRVRRLGRDLYELNERPPA